MTIDHLAPLDGPASALVIDDHPLFCDALVLTLRAICTGVQVDTAANLAAALAQIDAGQRPDVVLLDLNLPDVNGLDGLIRLQTALGREVPIVVVSSMADNRMISKALAAGAAGFVPKHSQKAAFHDALSTIQAGGIYTPDNFLPDSPEGTSQVEAVERLTTLTNQQTRILQLICEGKLNKQIAFDLTIAETTVKAHVTAIMRKLGVQSRTQAVLVAQEARFSGILSEGRERA
ncbi:response regulator transcription factor [Marinovum sp. 2_MG-2023]|uniref:response regulator n=1 Tax=Roseobacteraceae TaxID=2854170 RepID=UPI001FD151E4|nr:MULTISPECIES: response regulator transcription factor [Roseobacteraceae]MCJ7872376.1 response regulator transcription factor [Phaeobacter sp. J2-8]MDO6729356.1 response regulator transcription factor [Marinovum sp. 2_MG-2023]MDO6780428.1 response regulator transcription factor [Marinovum sp. 1_MG-2023]